MTGRAPPSSTRTRPPRSPGRRHSVSAARRRRSATRRATGRRRARRLPNGAFRNAAFGRPWAESARPSPIVASLTRVVLDTDHALVFITLSAVNPEAGLPDRRYVASVWSAVLPTGSMQWTDLAPGVQQPFDVPLGADSVDYS